MSSVRRPRGRLFQIPGSAAPKLLSLKLLCICGTAHMLSKDRWLVYTGHVTRRHFVLVTACGLGRRTLNTITHHSQPHTEQSVYQVCALSPAKPFISIGCHFYSKQNGVHGLIPSSLIGHVTCLYSTGLSGGLQIFPPQYSR